MTDGPGRGESWPSQREPAQLPLPRLDELPLTSDGYDPERVREAFNVFYRHLAQLDTTLQALEAVAAFRDQATELRRELRAFKTAGWSQQAWPPPYVSTTVRPVGPGLPPALPRLAIEAGFLIVVAVLVFLAHFEKLAIVLIMALAWAIVAVVEWAATRERFAPPRPVATPPRPAPAHTRAVVAQPPLEQPALADPAGWAAYSEPAREGVDALTMVGTPPEPEAEEPAPAPQPEAPPEPEPVAEMEPEPEPEPAAVEPEPEPSADEEEEEPEEPRPRRWFWGQDSERPAAEPAETPRRRFWHRRREHEAEPEASGRFELRQPRHVRVLPSEPEPPESGHLLDPWEQEFDISVEEELEEPAPDRR